VNNDSAFGSGLAPFYVPSPYNFRSLTIRIFLSLIPNHHFINLQKSPKVYVIDQKIDQQNSFVCFFILFEEMCESGVTF
jgi:hypothetical protein